jgi:hypothetical protein
VASIELLDPLRAGFHDPVEVLERKPPAELVATVDILRTDGLGLQVVACPAGQVPPHWQLTEQEREALIVPPDPPPDGTLEPGHSGFTPRNTSHGFTIEHNGGTW